ncbi:amino acid ABC transporter substrate-binding protein [Achromobacter sp. GG226]|uniref:amino acid ABC transporter substrate-binding protein n=1 Tax=Verticiella alkaliphila TaxID=2779529 RepID=UPI001C0E42CD|nr:amino acid ABC transporter substrate-binding protein [Verticiella sp. GG226]MBU4609932.1 amino acid ABC transporter substrate-binding protein [Verticiella sp. GG226]
MATSSTLTRLGAALALVTAAAAAAPVQAKTTLETVRERGSLRCGTTNGFAGFSAPDDQGNWRGLDIDLCRAIATAVLGEGAKIETVPLNSQQRFTALQSGEIDVLTRNTTITQQRETALGLLGAGVNFYDGQGFLVPRSLEVKSAKQLDGATICMQTGTSNENTLADWARANQVTYKPVVIEKFDEVVNAFVAGRCDVFSTDASGLASIRASRLGDVDKYVVLPEIISKEPLGPFVRQGDDQWLNIVKYSLYAMIEAEEQGITQANVEEMRKSPSPSVQRLLGVTAGAGKSMGLDDAWAYNIIKQVGNYGESFERNVGKGSPLRIERGLNALWKNGGLMYAMPIR